MDPNWKRTIYRFIERYRFHINHMAMSVSFLSSVNKLIILYCSKRYGLFINIRRSLQSIPIALMPMLEQVAFKHQHVQALAADLQQPMVAEVSLFQVAEAPTNMYDYTLPIDISFWINSIFPGRRDMRRIPFDWQLFSIKVCVWSFQLFFSKKYVLNFEAFKFYSSLFKNFAMKI